MIKIKNLTKKYDDTMILEQAEYTFPQTGIVCLMGASGGGKTTLLNLLAGFDTDYEGEIFVGNSAINQMNTDALCVYRRDNIGFVFQNYHLLPGYTVLENVTLACGLTEETSDMKYQKAKELLSRLGLAEKETQKIENLSGGQKQRVAIARALMGDPQIIFADEPTGALDRQTSTEIMELLCEIAHDKLVIVITHDQKICDFGDEIIHIKDKKIVTEQTVVHDYNSEIPFTNKSTVKISAFAHGAKNLKVHLKRYLAVSLAISIGLLAFLFSLSFGNVMEKSITDFQEKNTAFNSGYLKGVDDGSILAHLNKDDRIKNAYYQYKLTDIHLSLGDKNEPIIEKFPGSKATESLSYGVMPRLGKNEISITPSLAKKFDSDIKNLIGKEIILTHNRQKYPLTVSGIFNAGYDDFFVSSDVEQQLYKELAGQENYSIYYEVGNFSDIVAVSNSLELRGITAKTAANEVYALQTTFKSLNKLFLVISILILVIALFICTVLLFKLQNTRYHEVGLLSALGFSRHQISSVISAENILLSSLATGVNLIFLALSMVLSSILTLPFMITGLQIGFSVIATFAVVMLISGAASHKLIHTEPATALRK